MPNATTLAVSWHSPSGLSDDDEELKQVVSAAKQFGIKVLPLGVRGAEEFQDTFNKIIDQKADAVNILRSSLTLFHRGDLARLSIKSRLASICDGLDFAREGCLMAYGADLLHLWRRAAIFIDEILKGAKPADLPVEQPTKFELVINLKTAEALDLTIPPILRYQADKVIQ